MLTYCSGIFLTIGSQHLVRLDLQRSLGEAVVALLAELFRIVAAIARPWIILCLNGMDLPPVSSVRFRRVVDPKIRDMQVGVDAAPKVTIHTEGLLMAILTVIRLFLCI